MGVLDYDQTPGNNTSINGISIQGTSVVQNFDNALRQFMADMASYITRRVTKATNYTAVEADNHQFIEFTASATLSLTAAATLGDGWSCFVKATGGTVTIDPNSTEEIDGSSTKSLQNGSYALVLCNGTSFHTIGLPVGTSGHVLGFLDGNNTWSGTQTYTGIITSARTLGTGNQIHDWQQGYKLYSDNTGLVGSTRLWFDAPSNGEMYFGPRSSGQSMAYARIRVEELNIQGVGGAYFNVDPSDFTYQTYKVFHQGNIVGTVSQSGGTPTGAVVEKGSNSNGYYVRFADGTQICWQEVTYTTVAINAAYGSLYLGGSTWTFPASFSSAPAVACGQYKWGTSASWGGVNTISSSDAVLRVYDIQSRASGTSTYVAMIATGRWY